MRHKPSFHSSFATVKSARVALAAGALASLVVIAACSDYGNSQKSITAPSGPRAANTSSGTQGHGSGFAGRVEVCVDASSPAGTYKFTNSGWNSGVALDGVTPDAGDGGAGLGPASDGTTVFNPASGVSTEYTVAAGVGGCVTVLDRTDPSLHYSSPDPANGFPVATNTDDWQAVNVTATTTPVNVVYDHTDCVLDVGVLPPEPSPCGSTNNPTRAFANYDHGVRLIFFFSAVPQVGDNCTYTQGYYKTHESYTAGVLSGNAGTTYINGSGQLLIGAYALTAAQVDAILDTPVGKGYNAGGVVFTKDQLGMIHQLITAELNIAGGASPASIAAIITAANAGYTSATKSQLSSWTNALANFNEGNAGVSHCD